MPGDDRQHWSRKGTEGCNTIPPLRPLRLRGPLGWDFIALPSDGRQRGRTGTGSHSGDDWPDQGGRSVRVGSDAGGREPIAEIRREQVSPRPARLAAPPAGCVLCWSRARFAGARRRGPGRKVSRSSEIEEQFGIRFHAVQNCSGIRHPRPGIPRSPQRRRGVLLGPCALGRSFIRVPDVPLRGRRLRQAPKPRGPRFIRPRREGWAGG
jgi:hypothetical protein